MTEIRGVVDDQPVSEQLQPPLAAWSKPDGRVIPVLKFRVETAPGTFMQVYHKGETHGTIHLHDEVTVRGADRHGVLHAEYIYNHSTNSKVTAGGCSPCFIATAVYGTAMAEEVVRLRQFRDQVLVRTAPGRLFVSTYYRLAPPVAGVVSRSELLRRALRTGLLAPLLGVAGRIMAVRDKNGQ